MTSSSDTKLFTGHGAAGNWSDAANWNGGVVPGAGATAIIPVSTSMNGSFTTHILMMLGNETVTVNGALTTTYQGNCNSFMICEGATAIFTPKSALNDAGGLVVGNEANGTLVAQSGPTGKALLQTNYAEIGLQAGGNGNATIAGAVWNDAQNMYVGLGGNGVLTVNGGGKVSVGGNFLMAANTGVTGTTVISGGGQVNVAGLAGIGGGLANGGVANLSVASGSVFSAGTLNVNGGSTLSLAGGTVSVTGTNGMSITGAANVSGYGTITATQGSILNWGTITAAGGTLSLNGNITGHGTMAIGANATLSITAASVSLAPLSFTGADATLVLSAGIADHATITGFTAGDHIVMAGLDQIGWNSTTDILTLEHAGAVVDTLHFSGTFTGDPFTLTQSPAGGMIGFTTHI